MFFGSKKDKEKTLNIAKLTAEELRQGKQNYLSTMYQTLASEHNETIKFAADEIAKYMQHLESHKVIRLSENFRTYTSMEWMISWEKVDLDVWETVIESRGAYLWVLRLGTFHPNGYFRERCIERLAGDRESVKVVILRLNDWAEPVRKAAQQMVNLWIKQLSAEELVACLPYLEKVKYGCRRNHQMLADLEELVAQRIQEQLQTVDLKSLGRYDIKARKYLYGLLLEHRFLSKDEVNYVLNHEKNSQCQFLLMTMLLKHYEFSIEELDKYINHKSKVVQRKALEQKYSIVKDYWDGLEEMLLASSASVRGQAGYILQKHTDIDVVAYYAQQLDAQLLSISQKKICIWGIGEYGSSADADKLVPYLESDEEGIVKHTLHAVSRLLGTEADEIFWKYLQDERSVIQRAAYREIMANNISYGAKRVYELFISTDSVSLKEKLAHQFHRENSWDRLPYLLRLFWYEEETIRTVLQSYAYNRSVYGKITQEAAENIRSILYHEQYRIPQKLAESIEFDLRFVVK